MKVFRYLAVSVDSIFAHKLRAALTMLGIIIGIAAVLVTVGIGSGAAASITERIESSGTNLLTISAGASRGLSSTSSLTLADADLLADATLFPDIVAVAPQYSSSATVIFGSSEGSYTVVGTTANYATVRNLTVAGGAFLSDAQVAESESVAVIGDTVASDLFGADDPVGQTVRVDDTLFTVIGVLEASGGSGFGSSDSQIYVPLGSAQGRLFNAGRSNGSYAVSSISVQGAGSEVLDALQVQIEQILRLRHRLAAADENDFMIQNQADMLQIASDVSGTLTALLGSIGAVSLIVGGIGIMNIMLVSVTERTSEIGLRRALGAHDGDILLQFLVEALVLCALGGVVGIGLSFAIAQGLALLPAMSYRIVIEPWAVALALAVSTASGFIFGLYPAMRATKLDPIEALRFE
ncbi:MAG: ABC transporter permease [Caldilinea sp.]|nr:ABC transporter permease [Caldilineaceae bacterium]MCO5210219.1 ABC transporter permease [Caldilinea sp.]MCW5840625.1 ABC transporter permease [Caldilinea sp.]